MLDFVDIDHGLDVLADRVLVRDRVWSEALVSEIQHCLDLAWRLCADARGSAADEFRGLLFDLDAESVSQADVDVLRAALGRWAIDNATAEGIDRERKARALVRAGNAEKVALSAEKVREWQRRANELWRDRPSRKKADIAGQIAEEFEGTLHQGEASYIQSQIRKSRPA